MDRFDNQIYTFNLGIRLGKLEQSALFRVSPVVLFLVELLAAVLGNHLFFPAATLTAAKPPFFNFARETDMA